MKTKYNMRPPVETYIDYRRSKMTPPNTPRIYTNDEIAEWAGRLGREAARGTTRDQNTHVSKHQ